MVCMENELVIQKVDKQNFDEFLGLIDKLAEFEELSPPDERAKERLRSDGLLENPKYEAFIGKIGTNPVGYVVYFFTYSTFLALPTLYLRIFLCLKSLGGRVWAKKCSSSFWMWQNGKVVVELNGQF